MSLKTTIGEATTAALRARDKTRLGALRLINAEIKRIEVDERCEIDDARVLAILDKMIKQRADSERQYRQAGRDDLADQEAFEIDVIREFMPAALTAEEVGALVDAAIAEAGADSMRQMGQVMALLRPRVQGRADMGAVSALVRSRLTAS